MTQHTPGPWEWKWEEKDLGWFNQPASPVLRGPDGKAIIEGYSPYEEGGLRSDYPQEVAEANSHLISAGPEMLAALKEVMAHVAEDSPDMWGRVISAIEKAEGRVAFKNPK